MYTVILYPDEEPISIAKYKFVFSSFQADDQLYLCEWRKGSGIEKIVNILNEVTQSRSEWKLIIFAGMCQVMDTYFSREMPDELYQLVCLYSGRKLGYGITTLRSFPEQIYYIVCRTPQPPSGSKQAFYMVDQCQNFGNSFRMFWFEVNTDCEKNISYDLFRLNCAVLALAVNTIPSGLVEYGYLHHLEIDINKDLLAQYVLEREQTLQIIRQQLEIEGEKLQERHKTGVDYPAHTGFHVELNDLKEIAKKAGETEQVKPKDLRDLGKLSCKLENNRAKVLRRLCYPKGVLHGKAASLQKEVENASAAGNFLNEGGKDELERRKWETLEIICKEKREWLRQLDFEREFEEKEERVRKCAEKKITWKIKLLLGFLLSLLEFLMIAPFFWYSWSKRNDETEGKFIYTNILKHLSKFKPFHTWEGIESWPAWILLLLICAVIVFLCIFLAGLVAEITMIRAYNKHMEQKLNEQQKEKGDYLVRILGELTDYQYCMRLSREQSEWEIKWNEERQRLRSHRSICRQSNVICLQLKSFINVEQIPENIEIIPVNIREDPQDIEYYWVPFKNSKGEAEINSSGAHVNVAFYFVTGVHITKTLR